ncbi:uncharacterized protein TNCV_277181 [Trichonephila clavipes]|uniref:Uncharacterized protein n=1 Tax=Trichonephila clavipes TaxID=2585209 RepID=A0A8X6S7K6_TRICX|nr:uncharacterized protein TNCV_277181 [Trichonephila clavipes]
MISHTCSFGDKSGDLAGQVPCVTEVPAAVPTQFDASSAVRRIRRSSLLVVPRGHPEPRLLQAILSLDHCFQQLCTVDTFRPSLSALSRKENPPFVTRPRSNSVSY